MFTSCVPSSETKYAALKFKWMVAGILPEHADGMPSLGLAGPVAGISNDRLIIGGGSNFPNGLPWNGGNKVYYNTVYVFKKTDKAIININQNIHLPYPVAYSANGMTDKGIVVAGGENENGALNKVLLLNWNRDRQDLDMQVLPNLPQPLTAGSIAAINNDLYFAGGQNAETVSGRCYHLDLNNTPGGWDALPQLPKPVTHAVLYAQSNGTDSCLYLVGGRKKDPGSTSVLYRDVYQFCPKENRWTQKASLPYVLSAHSGVAWRGGILLIFSGDRGKTFHETEILTMKIANEIDPVEEARLIKAKEELQKNHPGFDGNVLCYNTQTDEWKEMKPIGLPGQVTTTAIKWGNDIVIPCGEIKAGVRTPDIILGTPF